ncbi:MAG: hypothetical protein CMB80_21185 [Flammeovirgaceae bacterium]|nr:hypothetical protein [Flammeovirgaceae bacterium]MBE61708.1 hypothetical protein [Flammeovirgaceae bacterium]HCX20266.1 hypothetical protein [Cytophagales bacterium]
MSMRKNNGMKATINILLVLIVTELLTECESKKEEKERPNILYIMSDDHAVNAIGCYDMRLSDVAYTPNIDNLASEGMRFSNVFVTNSICTPSRAAILTGKYSHENGVYILNQPIPEQPTSATILQDAGYTTALFGKWHLVSEPFGLDEYMVLEKQGRYQDPEFFSKGSSEKIEKKGWADDVITDLTMDYIKGLDKSKPFYVMTQFKGAHDPWDSRTPFDTLFENIDIPIPDNLCDTYENRTEASKRTTLKLDILDWKTFHHTKLETDDICEQRKHIYQQYIKAYLRSAAVMDYQVGRLMEFLEEQGLAENTIVVYTSDQGHFLGEHGFFSKRFMYDESMQMPLIVRYPGKIKAGSVEGAMVANIDFAPTLIDLVGEKVPADMQGESIKGFLFGNPPTEWRDGIYYHYWQHILHRDVAAHYGIRTKDYKLIFFYGLNLGQTEEAATPPEWELFDLRKDPMEMNNVYADPEYADVVEELKLQMDELKTQYHDTDDQFPELDSLRNG